MRTIYLMRPYGTARLDGEQLVVRQREEEIERVGLPLVDQILVVFVSRQGWCDGRLQPLAIAYRHRARYQQQLGEGERLVAARRLISAKIANGRVLLPPLMRCAASATPCCGTPC
jgi:CRISPR-associated protein Cas1